MAIKFRIDSFIDRQNMVLALANSGYKAWVQEIKHKLTGCITGYNVCVDEDKEHHWQCSCGHWNGANNMICAACGRKANGEHP